MNKKTFKVLVIFLTLCIISSQWLIASPRTVGAAYALEWTPLNEPGSGGQFSSIVVSPYDSNKVFLSGDMLGLGISTDGGETWNRSQGFIDGQIHEVTFHPENPQIVWAGSSTGPYKSTDGGFTFNRKA